MNKDQLTAVYRVIAELFLHPATRDGDRIQANMERIGTAKEVRASLDTFLAAPAAVNEDEYVSTLELSPLVPPYLGSHIFAEPNSCRGSGMSGRNGYMLELKNIYRHFGVEFTGGEMPDFVPVIVEFLGISLERMDKDPIGLRRYFVETLLQKGFTQLLSELQEKESPYAHLIAALLSALAEDTAHMAGGPKWQPPVDDKPPQGPDVASGMTTNDCATSENRVSL